MSKKTSKETKETEKQLCPKCNEMKTKSGFRKGVCGTCRVNEQKLEKTENGIMHTCDACGDTDIPTKFHTSTLCQSCHGKKIRENAKEKNKFSEETKECKECGNIYNINKIHGFVCNYCHNKRKDNKIDKWLTSLGLITREQRLAYALENHRYPAFCNCCFKQFDCNKFRFVTKLGKFRNPCNDCFNNKKYYKDSRGKERAKDEIEYLRKCAERQSNWRKNNPEKVSEINNKRKVNSNEKIKDVKKQAKTRNIYFENDDIEFMKDKLTLNCLYCGFKHNINLNGLDRLDNNLGYTNENTVSCCSTCNNLKKDYDLKTFFGKIKDIFENTQSTICDYKDNQYVPFTNFGSGKTSGSMTDTKKDKLISKEFENQIKESLCYYCNKEGGGIDRIDSSKCYTEDNCVPACSICNYIKKDYSVQDFIRHIRKIYYYLDLEGENYDESVDEIKEVKKTEEKSKKKEKVECVEEKEKEKEKNNEINIEKIDKNNYDIEEEKKNEDLEMKEEKIVVEEKKNEELKPRQYNQHQLNSRHFHVILKDAKGRIVAKNMSLKGLGTDFLHYANLKRDKSTNVVREIFTIEHLGEITDKEYKNIIIDKEAEQEAITYLEKYENNMKKKTPLKIDDKEFNSAREASTFLGVSNTELSKKVKEAGQNNKNFLNIKGYTVYIL
jgi:hypothetical protein